MKNEQLRDASKEEALVKRCDRRLVSALNNSRTKASGIFQVLLRTKSLTILASDEKGLDHVSVDEISVELIELVNPEFPASKVRVLRIVRISSQIAIVLHEHECAVGFPLTQVAVIGHLACDTGSSLRDVCGRSKFSY